MPEAKTTIDVDNDIERWEWRCPREHIRWEVRETHWWCHNCASDVDK